MSPEPDRKRPPTRQPSSRQRAAPTVTFRTLGCKLNQCETAQMEETVLARGYRVVEWAEAATVRVLNTCTVTAKTDRTCRHEIRRAKRRDPNTQVVVTGCYAHVAPEAVAAIPAVDLVLGNVDKFALADHLDTLLDRVTSDDGATNADYAPSRHRTPDDRGGRPPSRPRLAVTPYASATSFSGEKITHFSGYTRAFLKVQNGCDASCAYCVIPRARGPARSMPLLDVLGQVRLLAEEGYREIVLTGIHLGAWGRDTAEGGLRDLLAALAAEPSPTGVRFRLSSTEPMEVDDEVLAVMLRHEDRFADHFHVPLQSGSPSVLRRMNRPYDPNDYSERVYAIRSAFPDAAIGADVIVGFPGETDADFEETLALVESLPLTYLHVFAYSDRPGTAAAAMPDKVPSEVVTSRSLRLRELGATKRAAFENRFVGRALRALVLNSRSPTGRLIALTGNYIDIQIEGDDSLVNRFVEVRVDAPAEDAGRLGTVVGVERARSAVVTAAGNAETG